MSLFRQSAIAALSAILLTGSRFVFTAILVRRLSIEEFGRFAYAQWLVDITFLICALGATGAVSRYVAEFQSNEQVLHAFIKIWRRWAIALSLLGGGGALFGAWLSSYIHDGWVALLIFAWAVTGGVMAMSMAALSGFQKFELIFRSNLIFTSVILIGACFLPFEIVGINGLFAVMVLASGLSSLPGVLMLVKFGQISSMNIDEEQVKRIKKYALNMWLVALLWSLVWSRGELPIVKALLGNSGVASYVAVLTLFAGAIQGVMLGVSAVAPQLTRLWGAGRESEAIALARSIMDLQLLICGVGALALIYMGPELLTLAFGMNYKMYSGALAILSVGLISMAVANQNHILQIATDGKFSRDSLVFSLFVLAGLSFLLTNLHGISGAAAARALTMLFIFGITLYNLIGRWGREAVSIKNIIFVGANIFIGVFISVKFDELIPAVRFFCFGVSLIFLVFFVRDESGLLKVNLIFRKFLM